MTSNLGRVLTLAFGYLLLFTMFQTQEFLATLVLEYAEFGALGFYSLSLVYGSWAVFSFTASATVSKLGSRKSLIIGALGYITYSVSFILVATA
jgi:hypothetical protein